MNIHIVTIAYGLPRDTALLLAQESEENDLHWHLFQHSKYPEVVEVCKEAGKRDDVTLYPYGINRGVARSWNEGILAAYGAGADVVIVSNDDILPAKGDIDRLAEAAMDMRERYVVAAFGHDIRGDTDGFLGMGFYAINPIALDVVGMFDEQFFPMYFEDIDYCHRAVTAGLLQGYCDTTQLVHKGSANIYTVPGLKAQNDITFEANAAYYRRKWGGVPGREKFRQPFNDVRFGLRIAPCDRGRPYWGYERGDHDLVKM